MKVKIEYDEALEDINDLLNSLPSALEEQEKAVLKSAGNIIKKNVKQYMKQSDVEQRAEKIPPSNYDGSRPYVHMKDDIKASVRKDKMGNYYVSVRGGKMTGFKWHQVSDGHLARDGSTFVPGDNFMGKAVKASEPQIEKLIDGMLKKVTDG